MGCFSGRLMSAASDQKLFCELCSAFSCSFDEFVGEKVVSPSYSSTILAPPLSYRLLMLCLVWSKAKLLWALEFISVRVYICVCVCVLFH